MADNALNKKIPLIILASFIILVIFFFVPAGTLDYWQAWGYLSVIFVPFLFVALYFLKNDPEFLERRMKMKEKETEQKSIIAWSKIIFIVGFLLPGIDHRFGWSNVPFEAVILANTIVFLSYIFIFFVFKENSYAART